MSQQVQFVGSAADQPDPAYDLPYKQLIAIFSWSGQNSENVHLPVPIP